MVIEKPDNLVDLLEQSTDRYNSKPLFGTRNLTTNTFDWVTYGDVRKRIDNFRGGLASLGISKGDAVGIIANNCTEWAVAAFATYGCGGRFIPMYENETFHTWQYIIQDANIRFLLVSSQEIYDKVQSLLNEIETLEFIYLIDDQGSKSMSHLEKIGSQNPVDSIKPNVNDIAALIYTSGTTSDPKGVLLTHGNFVSNARAGNRKFKGVLNEESVSLSILPWAHSYGQTAELYNWFMTGGKIGFMHSLDTLAEDFLQVKPTFLIAVPRIFNRIYTGIHERMQEEGGIKQKLFNMAVEAAKLTREQHGNVCLSTKIKLTLGKKLVFSKIQERFGGRLIGSITGSAMMNEDIAYFYSDIGIPVYNCYGLSETSPAISMNSPEENKPSSVGKPLEFIQARIDTSMIEDDSEDGEIQVMGPNLMVGYHNKPEITKQTFTEDGWLKTGDRGRIDKDGYIYITGRLKEQYKLENGKYVFPSAIEEDITLLPYIEMAMIYGDGKPYNICLAVPDKAILQKTANKLNVKTEIDKLILSPVVQEFMSNEIKASLKEKYGGYEIPKKFIFIDELFTVDNGMLTQTLKLKRRNVLEKYSAQIAQLYEC